MSERPFVSVLVLNYQGERHLEDCLGSLTRQTYDPIEIVVADNGSWDRSEDVARRFDVRWEPLGSNFGFSLGNNLGVDRCKGDIVVFVNNDMRFDVRFVEELVAPLRDRSDPSVFATDARQLSWNGDKVDHGATRLVRTSWRAAALRRSSLPTLDLLQDRDSGPTEVVAACGSAMAIRKEMFDELGGFDTRMVAGWEDIDICWRASLRGWSSQYVPAAVAWHKVGASSSEGEGARTRVRGSLGGRLVFVTKHLPLTQALSAWFLAIAGLVEAGARGRRDEAAVRCNTIIEAARVVPRLAYERRELYRLAGTSPRRFLGNRLSVGIQEIQEVVFLLGRRDEPTDGVEDYCTKLKGVLEERGIQASLIRIPWAERGLLHGVALAFRIARGTSGSVNLQFTQLSWSRRGVPLRALAIVAAIRLAGAEVWVTVHDPTPSPRRGLAGSVRARVQGATMTALTVLAARAFVTVDAHRVAWASRATIRNRLTLLPVGTNIAPTATKSRSQANSFRVAVFSITEGPKLSEVVEIAEVINCASAELGQIHLSVFGRGATEAVVALRAALTLTRVTLVVEGVLEEAEVSQRLADADALLFLRGTVSTRRGTTIAAIAHGLPIVGYGGSETAPPITRAGVLLVPPGDTKAAAVSLVKIARDAALRAELFRNSATAYTDHFSWPTIATHLLSARQL